MLKRINFLPLLLLLIFSTAIHAQQAGGANADAQKYKRPTLLSPPNNKVFTEKDFKNPITFRCTPVVPKPQEPVIYHFRIWQVALGQTPVQAMRGQPVVEKEVENFTQINITSGLFPCNPNCQFVWTVQATNREGKPWGENNGTSEFFVFQVNITTVPVLSKNETLTRNIAVTTNSQNR